jgi:diguanylate cyclase (GGDEF)-like protein
MAKSTENEVLPKGGIGRRMVRLTVLSAVVCSITLGGLAAFATYHLARERAEEAQATALRWSAEHLNRLVSDGGAEIEAIAGDATLRHMALRRSHTDLSLGLTEHLTRSRSFSGLLVLTPEGDPLAAAGEGVSFDELMAVAMPKRALDSGLSEAMRSADLRRALTSSDDTAIQIVEPREGMPLAIVSSPLRDAKLGSPGSIHGLLHPERMAESLHAEQLAGAGSVRILDAGDRILAETGVGVGVELASIPRDRRDAADAPGAHLIRRAGETPLAWALASALPLEDLGWTLVVQQGVEQAFAPLAVILPGLVFVSGCLILGMGTLASMMAGRSVRPLVAVTKAIRRVTAGDFDVQLPAGRLLGPVGALFRAFNGMTAKLLADHQQREQNLRALSEQNQAFQKEHQILSRLSVTDGLTELNNHRYFQDQLRREEKRLSRAGLGLSMLIIDIDDFKKLNDSFGHAAGDEFLRQLAQILRESVRETDLLARYGGEEFVIVATTTNAPGAALLGEKLRTKVAESSFIVDETKRPRRMTISIGVAAYRDSRSKLFADADAALYRAKAAGKNCVMIHEPEDAEA